MGRDLQEKVTARTVFPWQRRDPQKVSSRLVLAIGCPDRNHQIYVVSHGMATMVRCHEATIAGLETRILKAPWRRKQRFGVLQQDSQSSGLHGYFVDICSKAKRAVDNPC